jgi:hypothetical protein
LNYFIALNHENSRAVLQKHIPFLEGEVEELIIKET